MKKPIKHTVKSLLASAERFVKPPPSGVTIPPVPDGFVQTPSRGRGVRPKKAELAVLSECVRELARFGNYAGVFGATAPPAAQIAQAFHAAGQWSSLTNAAKDFIPYSTTEETIAWKATRVSLARLKASFLLAASADPSLTQRYPNLTALFGVGTDIAKRAYATRKRDAKVTNKEKAQAAAPAPAPVPVTASNGVSVASTNGSAHPPLAG